jgi:uncharacterized membrane protein YebE (DUF533 family)
MKLHNLLDQFVGAESDRTPGGGMQGIGDTLHKLAGNIPGGAAAGGIMALLMSSKSARKLAGKAARYGGAALLGGLAYTAYRNWQQNHGTAAAVSVDSVSSALPDRPDFTGAEVVTEEFQLTLIKAMIAAANADGHIDVTEQQAIFRRVEQMALSREAKGLLFDLLQRPITVQELAVDVDGIERKSEVYLASCLAIDPDRPAEQAHLDRLATALDLPDGLADELQRQARRA